MFNIKIFYIVKNHCLDSLYNSECNVFWSGIVPTMTAASHVSVIRSSFEYF